MVRRSCSAAARVGTSKHGAVACSVPVVRAQGADDTALEYLKGGGSE